MLSGEDRRLAVKYAPRLFFDESEPFFPVRFGITVLRQEGDSPSFRRRLAVNRPDIQAVIEYAVYYDYDIQHLYDLEHVWIYIGRNGEVADAEASFHGKVLKALLRGRANLSGTRVGLYVQPGKHALSPLPEVFELLPGFASCTQEGAGADGLIYGPFFRGILSTDEETDRRVRVFLQTCRFTPSLSYGSIEYADREDLFVSWDQLFAEIPGRIRKELQRLQDLQPPGMERNDDVEGAIMYKKLVERNDEAVEQGLTRQVLDPASRYYGGTIDPGTGIAWVNHTTGTPTDMCYWGAALVSPESRYYRDEHLLDRLQLAAEFVLRAQHEDGTISPGWTNYHSPPDTAFVIVGYAQLYQLLEKHEWEPLQPVLDNMRLFLERTLPAMLTGGCHTPNHRWVLCAALGFLHELFGGEETLQRADQWLAEGMDITPDGEWTERSNGIYSAVSDIMLIHAARLLDRPELLEPVRRNLHMMVYLVHPTGEVVTDYSGRQDLGSFHDLSPYYLPYAILARTDGDPLLAGMAEWAGQAVEGPGVCSVNALVRMMLEPELQQPFEASAPLPVKYEKILNGEFGRHTYLQDMESAGHQGRICHSRLHTDFGAPVARYRDGRTSVTLITETPSFFALRHGAVRLLAVQLASYFYPGYVAMQEMVRQPEGYRLAGEQKKGYYGPVEGALLPPTSWTPVSPWYLLPHQSRPLTHEQTFRVEAEVQRTETGWTIRLHGDEPEEVMTQLSFIFGREGSFTSGELEAAGEDRYLWSGGTLRYECGEDWIELTGGGQGHRAVAVREAKLQDHCKAVLVNFMTPFDKTVTLTLSPSLIRASV